MDGGALSVEIDEDLADEVKAAAAASGVPLEAYVRDALTRKLFSEIELSDDPDPQIDERIVSEALRRGETIPWESVRVWMESWGKADELPPPRWRK